MVRSIMVYLYANKKNYHRITLRAKDLQGYLPKCIAICDTKEELDKTYEKKFNPNHNHPNIWMIEEDNKWKLYSCKEGHASMFYYPDDSFPLKKGGLCVDTKGYKGSVYSNWIYLDFDKENDVPGCAKLLAPFLNYLRDNKIFNLIALSGSKGFHIYIPIGYIAIPDKYKDKADMVCKYFLQQLLEQFPELNEVKDNQVYGSNHLFRFPFSSHDKTDKPKRFIEWLGSDINTKPSKWFKKTPLDKPNMERILSILYADKPMPVKPHWNLKTTFNIPEPKAITKKREYKSPYMAKVCIYNILNDPDPHKAGLSRNEISLTLLAHMHEQHFPEQVAWTWLQDWNETLIEPYSDKEIFSKMESYGGYSYSCQSNVKSHYCCRSNDCPFWKSIEYGIKSCDSKKAATQYAKGLNESTENYVLLNRIFKGFTCTLKPSRGHIWTIIADSGVGC